jgi:hypothetical protein
MSEFVRHEPSAREIAADVLARSGSRIPKDLLPEIIELLTDAAHDGLEFGESYAAVMNGSRPGGLAHWTHGYLAGLTDRAIRGED